MKKSKGVYEAEISKAITQWEKDFLGRGSLSVKTDILRDMVIINLQGILTPAEYRVCETNEGLLNIKRTRSELVESGQDDLNDLIFEITGVKVSSFHSDLSTVTGERVIVFKLEDNFEKLINQG
ncbi:DUF2294 domain-containing protein [Staphylococcus warneri]|uniref:DUF2294 domain-containing protein n=4 Tax=Bacillales TaxID=1385 RepID=A0A364USS5_STAWA|nr:MULTISPECIES: DUF2294 domain-containing protein [Staphylococcus]MBJ7886489.1 DUF2294 domain-containing protein [Bacillaceae bacterium HSR45]MCC8989486.1 DUF2294 domain-containing protein [Staphylococcus sp.]PAK73083.1 hypothetical protein B8W95_07355 [Staphylococcus pasteuri]COR59143.1 Uncharacterized conserved protein [Streptococcus pneumoniae]SKR86333.1 Uncharacterized conserved protein [Mycobacteroides abscessus subsp. abscessus]